ncbi:MAG: hypothetical protein F7B59_08425 [Desulfurococcales archaeon]|nr:hypothetical protein [Desulfurococcales archaeon]
MEASLYDTSAVIDIIANKHGNIPGYISIFTAIEYPLSLQYTREILYPVKNDYKQAIKWQISLRKLGNLLPATDLIITAQAYNNNLTLATLDNRFIKLKTSNRPKLKDKILKYKWRQNQFNPSIFLTVSLICIL